MRFTCRIGLDASPVMDSMLHLFILERIPSNGHSRVLASQRVGEDTLRIHRDIHLNNFAIEGKTRPFLRLNGTMVIEQMAAVMKRGGGPSHAQPGPFRSHATKGRKPVAKTTTFRYVRRNENSWSGFCCERLIALLEEPGGQCDGQFNSTLERNVEKEALACVKKNCTRVNWIRCCTRFLIPHWAVVSLGEYIIL
ncbi:hypothetical protein NPIL_547851 [Nephila pilipes]|uniref:Uncharacterized protein n=1 Tax=Nephila pilipes TaxID=299642 RepID=A0A8X6PQU2_NEPPI|nr:hypothetical protein NPIL_547851 [Nephila pilipes]